MNPLKGLIKPYYVYRPSQILRRIRTHFQPSTAVPRRVKLPWGLRLLTNGMDDMSHSLRTAGINDLTVTEILFRLTHPGALAVDVGANIGYTTSILSVRSGAGGRVFSFEPHPALYQELCANIADWKAHHADLAEIIPINCAVSDHAGTAILAEPNSFLENRGRSQIELESGKTGEGNAIQVEIVSLDGRFKNEAIDILKVDVEGHEDQVFAGANDLLAARRIQNILFEEHRPYPAKTHLLFKQHGYQVFVLEEHLLGPVLSPASADYRRPRYSPPNYLATCAPEQLREQFGSKGWQCLSSAARRGHPVKIRML